MRPTLFFFILFSVFLFGCQKELSTELGSRSRGSLQEINGECLPKTVRGIYAVNRALTDSNTIALELTVTTPGSYNISTDTVNGYFFRGSGRLTTPGLNNITLRGSGRPVQAGLDVFTIQFDSSFCTVQISVDTAGGTGGGGTGGGGTGGGGGVGGNPPTSTDMFPLTDGNTWTYWDEDDTTDTYTVTVRGTQTVGGRSYSRLISSDGDTTFIRKDGGGTYWWAVDTADADFGLTGSGIRFSTAILEIPIVKQPLTLSSDWTHTINATITVQGVTLPLPITLAFDVQEANTTLSYSGRNFSKVFKIKQSITIPGAPPGSLPFDDLFTWYAQGIGRIQASDGFGTEQLKSWNVR